MWSVPDVNHVSGTDLVNLGGPGRNRPGPRMADPISSLNSQMKVFAYYLIVIKTSSG